VPSAVILEVTAELADADAARAYADDLCVPYLNVPNVDCATAVTEAASRRRLMAVYSIEVTISFTETVTYDAEELAEIGIDLSGNLNEAVIAFFKEKDVVVAAVQVTCDIGSFLADSICTACPVGGLPFGSRAGTSVWCWWQSGMGVVRAFRRACCVGVAVFCLRDLLRQGGMRERLS
jgi:hypothetical protein